MVCGSGMNGRSREARSSGQPVKKHISAHSQKPLHKPTASAEALQMARILEDSKQTSEINSKVQKVLSVVPGCSEEQIHLALHDNGYDLDKTISALLDSDGQTDQGEWTTRSSRKARKKAPSTETEEASQNKVSFGRLTNRTVSNSTRDNYGGSVSVTTGAGPGRSRPQGTRSKGQSTGRRTRVGGATGDQRRSRVRDKERSHAQTPLVQSNTSQVVIDNEEWDIVDVATHNSVSAETSAAWAVSDVWPAPPIADHSDDSKFWEPAQRVDPSQPEVETQSHTVFPEAIPGQEQLLGQYITPTVDERQQLHLHSTPSEHTPSLANTGEGDSREMTARQAPHDPREKIPRKAKRLARSQIPTKPVEMPGGIDSLDVQFGELGIDFVGLEPSSSPPSSKDVNTDTMVGSMLPYSDLQQRFGEGAASVSISTSSSSTALGGEAGANILPLESSMSPSELQSERDISTNAGLRSPPGLPHPSASTSEPPQAKHQQPQAQLDSTVTTSAGLPVANDVASSQAVTVENQLQLGDGPSSAGVLKAMSMDIPMSSPPQTSIIESYPSVSSSGSVFSSSSNVSATMSSGLISTPSSRSTTTSNISQQHQPHLSQQGGKPSASNVPPGMLYPHMMPAQYPFIPAPAMYNYDPSDMSRYSSGSMAYFPTSSDPTMGGAMQSRDHTSSSYQTASDHTKFPRGGADLGTAIAVSSTQQSQPGSNLQQQPGAGQQPASGQQMGPAFMGAPFYGSMFYPTMYGPMPAFSQAAGFGMTYEEMVAAAAAGAQTSHDYSKIYAGGAGSTLNKPSSLPASSSGGLDSTGLAGSTSFKHLESGKSFNYSVPAGVGGSQATGYYMQMPPFPHMMVGHGDVGMTAPHSRISQQKHSNKVGVGYQGNSGSSNYWGSATNHSS